MNDVPVAEESRGRASMFRRIRDLKSRYYFSDSFFVPEAEIYFALPDVQEDPLGARRFSLLSQEKPLFIERRSLCKEYVTFC